MNLDRKFVSKTWGYELWIENNRQYCCKHLHVVPGRSCSIHFHKNKKETFYIINGELLLTVAPRDINLFPEEHWNSCEKESIILKKGDSFTLDTYTIHTFTSNTNYPCDFIETSTFHEDSDSYRINNAR